MMIDDASLAALREAGLRRGFLTIDDLRSALPVDRMNADAIALVVVQLEDPGLTVELDDDLIGASRKRDVSAPHVRAIDLPGAPAAKLDATRPAGAPGVAQDAYERAEPIEDTPPSGPGGWVFVTTAAALVGLGALILLVLYR